MLFLIACFRYCVELTMRIRKKNTERGSWACKLARTRLSRHCTQHLLRCPDQSKLARPLLLSPNRRPPERSEQLRQQPQSPVNGHYELFSHKELGNTDKVDSKVRADRNQNPSFLPHVVALIGSLCSVGSTGGIFT